MSNAPHEPETERRHYGTDTTDDHDTIVEATVQEDGTVHLTAVVMDLAGPEELLGDE